MTDVTEHDCEKEWEGNDRKQPRVDFLVLGDTIAIHDRLEGFCKLVGSHERGWGFVSP